MSSVAIGKVADPKIVLKMKKPPPSKMAGGTAKLALKEKDSFEKRVLDTRSEVSGDCKIVLHDHQRFENTYKMVPDEEQQFRSHTVEKLMKDMLEKKLEGVTYDGPKCGVIAKELSAEIKLKVKDLKWQRHKVVVQVLVGQDFEQSVQFGSRCLWDKNNDNYACATYKNDDLFAVAACFGVYYE